MIFSLKKNTYVLGPVLHAYDHKSGYTILSIDYNNRYQYYMNEVAYNDRYKC